MNLIVETTDPMRLDRYLRILYPLLPQSYLEQAIRHKFIKVNNKRATSSQRITNADTLSIYKDLSQFVKPETRYCPAIQDLAVKLGTMILYEDDNMLAIDKPIGIATQGGNKIIITIDQALKYISNEYRIVHRLDKDTSGILLVAKDRSTASKLTQAFFHRLIYKTYVAIVKGQMPKLEDEVVSKISKLYQSVSEDENGDIAITKYKAIKQGLVSMVEFYPVTGRMHQIRHHAQICGCPIIGDNKYQGEPAERLMLHAHKISIDESIFGNIIEITSPIPSVFSRVLY